MPWESNIFLGCFWHLSKLKFEEILPKISRMQILRKLAPLITIPPDSPGSRKTFLDVSGIYLSSSLKKENVDFIKTVPLVAPCLLAPLAPLDVKKFLGCFWHLSKLKFEEILPKISRMQILRKLSPLWPPRLLSPLALLGVRNFFGRFLASI